VLGLGLGLSLRKARGGGSAAAVRPPVYLLNDAPQLQLNPATDYDNIQLMGLMGLYANDVDYVGIGCTWPGVTAKATVKTWLETVYATDYPNLVASDSRYPTGAALSALVTQGSSAASVAIDNLGAATETSTDLIAKAAACSTSNRLRIIAGGPLGDLARAMRDGLDPTKVEYINTTAMEVGKYNYDQDAFAAAYVLAQFASGPWVDAGVPLIFPGDSYYGMYIGADPMVGADKAFLLEKVAGHGKIGDFVADSCIDSFEPNKNRIGLSAGDLCLLYYIIDNDLARGNGRDPTQAGWGGRFELDVAKGPNVYVDVASGETVNGHPGANTILTWRTEQQADLEARLDACCTLAPTVFSSVSLQGLSASVADITDLAVAPGPGTWKNYRTAGDRDIQIVRVVENTNDAWSYLTGTDANSSMFFVDGVEAGAEGNCEVELICRDTNTTLTGGGPFLAASGDLTTGKRIDGYKISSTDWSISKEINGSAVDQTVTQASTFPVTNNVYFRLRLRRRTNFDGTFTYWLHARNKFTSGAASEWVLIKTWSDTSSVITEPGKWGFRTNQTFRVYGGVYRTIPNVGASPVEPSAATLLALGGDEKVTLLLTPGDNGGSAITAYELHRSTSPTFTPGEGNLIDANATFPYSDTGRTRGVTYYYQVRPINAVGPGPYSAEVSGKPPLYYGIASLVSDAEFRIDANLTLSGANITGFTNGKAGGGDFTAVTPTSAADISRVANALNSFGAARFVRRTTGATMAHLDAASTAAVSQVFQGANPPWTTIRVFKPTDTNTGFVVGASDTVNATDSQANGLLVRRNATAASMRRGTTTANTLDSSWGSGMASGTWRIVASVWDGTTMVVYDSALTAVTLTTNPTPAGLTFNTELRYLIGVGETLGASDPTYAVTACAMDFAKDVVFNAALSAGDVQQAMQDIWQGSGFAALT